MSWVKCNYIHYFWKNLHSYTKENPRGQERAIDPNPTKTYINVYLRFKSYKRKIGIEHWENKKPNTIFCTYAIYNQIDVLYEIYFIGFLKLK